jgi:glutaredoxin
VTGTPEPNSDAEAAHVVVYTREDCHLCDEAIETIERVAASISRPVDLETIDVDADPDLRERYGERVPYVTVDGRPAFKYRVDADDLRATLAA